MKYAKVKIILPALLLVFASIDIFAEKNWDQLGPYGYPQVSKPIELAPLRERRTSQPIPSNNRTRQFDLNALVNTLSAKSYTIDQKVEITRRYISVTTAGTKTFTITQLLDKGLPRELVKIILLADEERVSLSNEYTGDELFRLIKWAKANSCIKCIDNSRPFKYYAKGNYYRIKISKLIKHSLYRTYMAIDLRDQALESTPKPQHSSVDAAQLAEVPSTESKQSEKSISISSDNSNQTNDISLELATLFPGNTALLHLGIGEIVRMNCDVLQKGEENTFILFSGCRIEGEVIEDPILTLIEGTSSKIRASPCMNAKELQNYLELNDIDVGAVDGVFGFKTLLGLREFQRRVNVDIANDLNPTTCELLKTNATSFSKPTSIESTINQE